MNRSYGFGLFALILAAFLSPRSSVADGISVFDLDSRCYMSSLVAEGEVVKTTAPAGREAGVDDAVDLHIDTIYLGGAKAGDTVTISDISSYQNYHAEHFEVGDKLFVFLKKADTRRVHGRDIKGYVPVESGFNQINHGTVIGAEYLCIRDGRQKLQIRNPAISVDQFRRSLQSSATFAAALKTAWGNKAKPTELPQLLALLKQRESVPCGDTFTDDIGHSAALRLISLLDPEAICSGIEASSNQAEFLATGFNTTKGRECLLTKVTDERTPMPLRIKLASDFAMTLWATDELVPDPQGSLRLVHGAPIANNGEYLKRIALIAVASEKSPELCLTVLQSLDAMVTRNRPIKEDSISADLANAVDVLRPFYERTSIEEAKFEVEIITNASSAAAFAKLHSKGGGLIAMLRRDPAKYPSGVAELDYMWPDGFDGVDSAQCVMQSNSDKKRYVLQEEALRLGPADPRCPRAIMHGCIQSSPGNLPKGSYHVFCQFKKGDTIVGESFGFDLEIGSGHQGRDTDTVQR